MRAKHSRRREQGQVLVMAALVCVLVVGAAGLAVDVGMMMKTKTTLQKDVDAMALAGAQSLCGTVTCQSEADSDAREWGTQNGVTVTDTTVIQFGVTCGGGTADDAITVRVTRYQASFFARVVGYEGGDIRACATARKFAIGGLGGVRPFGLEDDCIANISYGQVITLKRDSDTTRTCDAFQGNFGQLAIDGTGGSELKEAIKHGTESEICADSVPDCTNYLFNTQTGDQIGPVKDGLKYIYDNTPANCNEWTEVVTGSTGDEKINPDCNPWRSNYATRYGTDATRLWVIPVVDGMWSSGGNNSIRIKSFAILFLEDNSKCTGNSCDIKARFIEAAQSVPGSDKVTYYQGAKITAVVLTK